MSRVSHLWMWGVPLILLVIVVASVVAEILFPISQEDPTEIASEPTLTKTSIPTPVPPTKMATNTPILSTKTATNTPTPPTNRTITTASTPTPTDTRSPTATLAPPSPTTPPEAIVVSPNGLTLRSGPGTLYAPIGFFRQGDTLDIWGRVMSNEWIQVTSVNSDTMSGWVAAAPKFVRINVDLNPIPIIPPPSLPTLIPTLLPISFTQSITLPPTLVDPQDNATQYKNRIDLEWDWAGILGPNDYFQVEIRNRYNAFSPVIDESVSPIDVAWVKQKYYIHDRIDQAYEKGYDREFRWRIIVVTGIPTGEKQWSTAQNRVWEPGNEYKSISEPSEMRTLYVESRDPPSDDGSRDSGDNVCSRC